MQPTTTFIVMTASAQMPNSCWGKYGRLAVAEVLSGTTPKMISVRARGVRRIVRTWERLNIGHTERCAYARAKAEAEALAAHLNFMRDVRTGTRTISVADIVDAANEEFRRELIEAFGGFDQFVAKAGAKTIHMDETGFLISIPTAGEPIVAVRVTCPTTGRGYILRVPPQTKTAREGIAWTFGLAADDYHPTMES